MSTTDPPDMDALAVPEGIESSIQIASNTIQQQEQQEQDGIQMEI